MQQNPKVKMIYSAGENPGLISDVFVVREEFLAEKPGQIVALLKAWDAALADYRKDTAGGRAIIAEAVGAKPEELATAFDGVDLLLAGREQDASSPATSPRRSSRRCKAAARKAGILQKDVDLATGDRRPLRGCRGQVAGEAAPAASRSAAAAFRPRGVRSRIAAPRVFAVLGLAWYGVTAAGLVRPLFLPSPGQVYQPARASLAAAASSPPTSASASTGSSLGFLISTAVALPIGILIGCYGAWEAAIEPFVDFIRYMPVVAFVPLTILWAGTGDAQKFLIIFIGTFFQQVLLVMDNVKSVPRDFINLGRTLEMPEWRILQRIVLPSAMPAHLGLAADQPRLGLDLARRRRTRRRHLRPRLPHHHGAALLPDRLDLRLSADPRHSRPRHRPGDEACRPPAVPLSRGAPMTRPSSSSPASARPSAPSAASTVALDGVDLAIGENEFVALVGTSGCGKSTLLSIAAGLEVA